MQTLRSLETRKEAGCVTALCVFLNKLSLRAMSVLWISGLSLPSRANSQAEIPSLVATWVLMDQLRSSSGRKIELFYTVSGSVRTNPLNYMKTFSVQGKR